MDRPMKKPTIDRVSGLPEPIQHRIFNFLDEKEVARISVLSKTWSRIVRYRPVLCFSQDKFNGSNKASFVNIDESIQKFISRNLSIQKSTLSLNSYYSDRWDSHLDRWIEQLVNKAKLEELSLKIWSQGCRRWSIYYKLPQVLFSSKTITNLGLERCKIEPCICSSMKLPNLIELRITMCVVSPEIMENFNSGCCPSLEILKFCQCKGLPLSICVSGLPRLDTFVLSTASDSSNGITKVKIVAPRLRSFDFDGGKVEFATEIDLLACESTLRKLRLAQSNKTAEFLSFLDWRS